MEFLKLILGYIPEETLVKIHEKKTFINKKNPHGFLAKK